MVRRTMVLGGGGGTAFGLTNPKSIGLRSGPLVNAIIINGLQHGGGGGSATSIESLDGDDYWSQILVHSGNVIDYLSLTSRDGRTVAGGGGGGTPLNLQNVRIMAIGGRAYEFVDSLLIDVVIDYVASECVVKNATIVLDMAIAGSTIEKFQSQNDRFLDSYQKVLQIMESYKTNVSADAQQVGKISSSVDYELTITDTTTVKHDIEQILLKSLRQTVTVGAGTTAFLLAKADIMKDSDGNHWLSPTTDATWGLKAPAEYSALVGLYDLTSAVQFQTGLQSKEVNGFPKLIAA